MSPALPHQSYGLLPPLLKEGATFFKQWYERDAWLTAALGVLSACMPHVRLKYGLRYYSAHLFFFVLSDAARGKGVMELAFDMADGVDQRMQQQWHEDVVRWQAAKAAYESAKRSADEDSPAPPGPRPQERFLRMGEDKTLPALYAALGANPEGVLVTSSEADAVSNANTKEHGGFSHLYRKAFHHERAQKSTKSEGHLRVRQPRIALVLSGTRNQFAPLVDSLENGLFSRFAVYEFAPRLQYRSQRPTKDDWAFDTYQRRAQHVVSKLFETLSGRVPQTGGESNLLYIDVPDPLWDKVDDEFESLFNYLFNGANKVSGLLAASVFRAALITFRIAMVLAVLRTFEDGLIDLKTAPSIYVSEQDIDCALLLGLVYVEHSIRLAYEMAPKLGLLPDMTGVGGAVRMNGLQRELWDALGMMFTTAEAEVWREERGQPARSTLFDWLDKWQAGGILRKKQQGIYEKAVASDKSDFSDINPESAENSDLPPDSSSDKPDFKGGDGGDYHA